MATSKKAKAKKQNFSSDLIATVRSHQNVDMGTHKLDISEVHFTADGSHHFRAFEINGKKYAQTLEKPVRNEKTKKVTMVATPDPKSLIVKTVSAQEIIDYGDLLDEEQDAEEETETPAAETPAAKEPAAKK